jgi:hypothetical protein
MRCFSRLKLARGATWLLIGEVIASRREAELAARWWRSRRESPPFGRTDICVAHRRRPRIAASRRGREIAINPKVYSRKSSRYLQILSCCRMSAIGIGCRVAMATI